MSSQNKVFVVDDVVQEMNKNTNYVYEICKQILFVNLC